MKSHPWKLVSVLLSPKNYNTYKSFKRVAPKCTLCIKYFSKKCVEGVFQMPEMGEGYIVVQVYTADQAIPVADANVIIARPAGTGEALPAP